jgi:hypothetical protein
MLIARHWKRSTGLWRSTAMSRQSRQAALLITPAYSAWHASRRLMRLSAVPGRQMAPRRAVQAFPRRHHLENPMIHSFKHLSLALVATAAMNALAAPPVVQAPRVEVMSDRNDIEAAQAVLSQRDFDSTYLMSTGRRMNVTTSGDALQVRYGRRAPATLVHDGRGRFVSGDGSLSLRFALAEDGEPQLVRLALPAPWQ